MGSMDAALLWLVSSEPLLKQNIKLRYCAIYEVFPEIINHMHETLESHSCSLFFQYFFFIDIFCRGFGQIRSVKFAYLKARRSIAGIQYRNKRTLTKVLITPHLPLVRARFRRSSVSCISWSLVGRQ